MPYSERLAERVRQALTSIEQVEEKRMFGGLAFLVNEKMCINVGPGRLMLRVDPALHENLLQQKDCRTVVMRGREYKGFIYVDEERLDCTEIFDFWVALALDFNARAKMTKKKPKRKQ